METRALVAVGDYLRMSFDGPDREYLDGAIVERNVGDPPHSAAQTRFIEIFYELRKKLPLVARVELRHKVTESRYRIPDVAVYRGQAPPERVPSQAPYLAIEIVSPDDRHTEIVRKLAEYRQWGAAHIWLADPELRKLMVYGAAGLAEVDSFELPEYGVRITPAEIFD